MTDDDSIRYKNVLAELGIAFAKKITSPLTTLYWKCLKDIPIDLVEAAAKEITVSDRVFPRVARIRAVVDELQFQRLQSNRLLPEPAGETESCARCHDTGMVSDQRCGVNDYACPRCREGKPCPGNIPWASLCDCRKTNERYHRKVRGNTPKRYAKKTETHSYRDRD